MPLPLFTDPESLNEAHARGATHEMYICVEGADGSKRHLMESLASEFEVRKFRYGISKSLDIYLGDTKISIVNSLLGIEFANGVLLCTDEASEAFAEGLVTYDYPCVVIAVDADTSKTPTHRPLNVRGVNCNFIYEGRVGSELLALMAEVFSTQELKFTCRKVLDSMVTLSEKDMTFDLEFDHSFREEDLIRLDDKALQFLRHAVLDCAIEPSRFAHSEYDFFRNYHGAFISREQLISDIATAKNKLRFSLPAIEFSQSEVSNALDLVGWSRGFSLEPTGEEQNSQSMGPYNKGAAMLNKLSRSEGLKPAFGSLPPSELMPLYMNNTESAEGYRFPTTDEFTVLAMGSIERISHFFGLSSPSPYLASDILHNLHMDRRSDAQQVEDSVVEAIEHSYEDKGGFQSSAALTFGTPSPDMIYDLLGSNSEWGYQAAKSSAKEIRHDAQFRCRPAYRFALAKAVQLALDSIRDNGISLPDFASDMARARPRAHTVALILRLGAASQLAKVEPYMEHAFPTSKVSARHNGGRGGSNTSPMRQLIGKLTVGRTGRSLGTSEGFTFGGSFSPNSRHQAYLLSRSAGVYGAANTIPGEWSMYGIPYVFHKNLGYRIARTLYPVPKR